MKSGIPFIGISWVMPGGPTQWVGHLLGVTWDVYYDQVELAEKFMPAATSPD